MLLDRPKTDENGVTFVGVTHTGTAPEQKFRRGLVAQAVADGWMRIEGDKLTLVAEPEDLIYTINRQPGYYCKSTGERIPVSELAWSQMLATGTGDLTRREAQAWLGAKGLKDDDYEVTLAYECVLEPEQHAKFRAVRDVAGNVVAAHTQEG